MCLIRIKNQLADNGDRVAHATNSREDLQHSWKRAAEVSTLYVFAFWDSDRHPCKSWKTTWVKACIGLNISVGASEKRCGSPFVTEEETALAAPLKTNAFMFACLYPTRGASGQGVRTSCFLSAVPTWTCKNFPRCSIALLASINHALKSGPMDVIQRLVSRRAASTTTSRQSTTAR